MASAAALVRFSGVPPVADGADFIGEANPERRLEFEEVMSRHLPRFRNMARRWLGNREDAEDAVQDAMLLAFRNIAQFDRRAQMSTWISAIVINAVRMQMRRQRRVRTLSLDYCPEEGQQPVSELLVDPQPTPERIVERLELRALALKLVRGLPHGQRAALQLRFQNDFSIRKASKKLGITQGTLKAHLARGRAKLTKRVHEVLAKRKTHRSEASQKTQRPGCTGS